MNKENKMDIVEMTDEQEAKDKGLIKEHLSTDKDIIDNLDIPFKPIDGRVLIKPLEPVMLTKEISELDHEATMKARQKADKDGEDIPEAIFKTKTKEVESNLRIGIVLAIGDEDGRASDYKHPYQVGDKVVYIHKAAMPFELFKDTVLLQRYDIKGIWVA